MLGLLRWGYMLRLLGGGICWGGGMVEKQSCKKTVMITSIA